MPPGGTEIHATEILLNLAGGVALLLWSMRMVRTGILRAYGGNLRRFLSAATRNRVSAFAAGLGVTTLLQSSTATGLMVTSFVSRDLLSVASALAIMLGADVGTTLVAQVLSFNPQFLSPIFLIVGVVTFLNAKATRTKDLGRVAVGMGLLLLGLKLILAASAPMRESPMLGQLIAAVQGELLLGFLIGGLLAWFCHSSLAVVLLVISLGAGQVVPTTFALALIVGVNVGAALPALTLTLGEARAARRVPIGNMIFRCTGALLVLPLLTRVEPYLAALEPDAARLIANFHTVFNLGIAVLFLGLTGPVEKLCARILPDVPSAESPSKPRYLDRTVMVTPSVAIACAARETLRMGDYVAEMLRHTFAVFRDDDRKLQREVERTDDIVDSLHEAVKLYLTDVSREGLDPVEGSRCQEIIAFTTNLEHIGDIIDKNLMELAAKKIKNKLTFSADGMSDIEALHRRVTENLQLALGIFISGDVKAARQLIEEKDRFRELERRAAESHLERLRSGRPESIESSSLHLDVLRDLKRIHSHLASVAYPILERAGELRPSRLAATPAVDSEPNKPAKAAAGGGWQAPSAG